MAVYSGWGWDETFEADTDLSSFQYYFVTTASTAGRVKLATGASGPAPIGVLQNDPATAGEAAIVRILGSSKVELDGSGNAIGYGDFVTTGSDGKGEVESSASAAIAGIALAATSGCTKVEVLLIPLGVSGADNVP